MAENTESGLDVVKTGSGKGAGVVSESVLQQMEALYERKLAEKNSIMNALADASAWWSGGVAGPHQALAERQRIREEQDKNLLAMQSDIANKRVTLNMLRESLASMTPPGTAPTSGATVGGAGVTGGGATTGGASVGEGGQRITGGSPIPPGWGTYKGVPVPPEYWTGIRTALSHGDQKGADDLFEKYAGVKAKAELDSMYNLDQYTPITTTVIVGGKPTTVTLTKGQMRTYELTGKLPSFIQTPDGQAVTREAVDPNAPKAPPKAAPVVPAAPATEAPVKELPQPTRKNKQDIFSGIVAPTTQVAAKAEPSALANFADKALTLLTGSTTAEAAPSVTPGERQLPAVVVTPKPRPTTDKPLYGVEERGREQQHELDIKKEKEQTALKATGSELEKAGAYISKIQEQAKRADEVKRAATQIISHAKERPEEFAYQKQTDVPGIIAGATYNVPILGPTVENIREKFQGQDAIGRRNITDSNSLKLGIDYAVKEFTGTGTRTGAELFRRAAEAKGVGVNQTAKSNIYNAMLIGVEYAKAADQAEAWDKYQQSVKKSGGVPNPYEFLNGPTNKAIEAKWKRYLNENLPSEEAPDKTRKPLDTLIKKKETK